MANFDTNILPDYNGWYTFNAAVLSSGKALTCNKGGGAVRAFLVTDYTIGKYVRLRCARCTGKFFIYFYYSDKEDGKFRIHHIAMPNTGLDTVLTPQEATVNKFYIRIVCAEAGVIQQLSLEMLELGIRSVTVEYAQNTSPTTPPTTNWSQEPPKFSTGKYIWQRTVTTYEDGSTSYSDPMNIQTSTTRAILEITAYYRLTTSKTEAPTYGESYKQYWSESAPVWSTGSYIWTSSRLHWSDNTYTWSTPTLAKGLNDVNEKIYDVDTSLKDLDKSLDAQGVFNRLTNNGSIDGLYFETYEGKPRLFVNALKMEVGDIIVRERRDDTSSPIVFQAVSNSVDSTKPNSVYLAGFTASKNALYNGPTALRSSAKGVYLGIDGLTAGNGTHNITISEGMISGGYQSQSSGYLAWKGTSGGSSGFIISSMNHFLLCAPHVTVSTSYSAPNMGILGWSGSNKTLYTIPASAINQVLYVYGTQNLGLAVCDSNGNITGVLNGPVITDFAIGGYEAHSVVNGFVV